jgi:hypothetical protein
MGSYAEPVVLPLLKSTDKQVRNDAAEILGEVGGKKSKAALEALLKQDKEGVPDYQLKSALDKINERLATEVE